MFRIYCEDVNRKLTESILNSFLDNYTIIPAMGVYKGQREKSVVIDVFETTKEIVNQICQKLALGLHQELVVYTEFPCAIIGATGTSSILSTQFRTL